MPSLAWLRGNRNNCSMLGDTVLPLDSRERCEIPRRHSNDNRPAVPELDGKRVEDLNPSAGRAAGALGESWRRGWVALELIAVFALGATVMGFIYIDARGVPADRVGVPGYDAFYHIKMAAMLPEVGLVKYFPWLRHVYFSQLDSSFISHHYGFHVLLVPFVKLSYWLTGDYLMGGRWAISTFFGLALMMLQGLLISERIRWRWLWLIVFLMLPSEFFGRHAYVRAISPSLMCMLTLVLFMFRQQYVLAGLAVAAYTHLYLGSVVYTPLIVGLFVVSSVIGPRGDRGVPWRLILWTTLGWLVGLRTYPYFEGALEFLRMQVLGTGLNPDIAVGSEWSSYGNVWHFAVTTCGPLLAVWATALALRIRLGERLNARELSLMLIHFALLLLTFKAKRFIEYWPPFCLLSAAFLVAPVLNPLAAWLDPNEQKAGILKAAAVRSLLAILICAAVLTGVHFAHPDGIERFMVEWPIWSLLATGFILIPLTQIWLQAHPSRSGRGLRPVPIACVLLLGAAFAGAITLLARYEFGPPRNLSPELSPGIWGWLVLAGLFVAVGFLAQRPPVQAGSALLTRLFHSTTILATGVAVVAAVVLLCADHLVAVQRTVYCGYNLPAVRKAMAYLQAVSEPGDVVFTDDWDVFPLYFYHNSYNHYIVGLDPKFTHSRKPELWERYVKITRGQAPRTFEARWTSADGEEVRRKIHVELEDIRDYFYAKYVMTDRDHKPFAKRLAESPDFAELIYPKASYQNCKNAPYLIFRVREPGQDTAASPGTDRDGPLYLSDLEPLSVTQGWGELTLDRSVSDEPIHLGDRIFLRGLGTHAPLELTYEIPSGYGAFATTVGVNRTTEGKGSVIVSVEVDGREVYRSPLITGQSEAVTIRVPISGGRRLTLRAQPTGDGNRWDHVDWASARLLRASDSSN